MPESMKRNRNVIKCPNARVKILYVIYIYSFGDKDILVNNNIYIVLM